MLGEPWGSVALEEAPRRASPPRHSGQRRLPVEGEEATTALSLEAIHMPTMGSDITVPHSSDAEPGRQTVSRDKVLHTSRWRCDDCLGDASDAARFRHRQTLDVREFAGKWEISHVRISCGDSVKWHWKTRRNVVEVQPRAPLLGGGWWYSDHEILSEEEDSIYASKDLWERFECVENGADSGEPCEKSEYTWVFNRPGRFYFADEAFDAALGADALYESTVATRDRTGTKLQGSPLGEAALYSVFDPIRQVTLRRRLFVVDVTVLAQVDWSVLTVGTMEVLILSAISIAIFVVSAASADLLNVDDFAYHLTTDINSEEVQGIAKRFFHSATPWIFGGSVLFIIVVLLWVSRMLARCCGKFTDGGTGAGTTGYTKRVRNLFWNLMIAPICAIPITVLTSWQLTLDVTSVLSDVWGSLYKKSGLLIDEMEQVAANLAFLANFQFSTPSIDISRYKMSILENTKTVLDNVHTARQVVEDGRDLGETLNMLLLVYMFLVLWFAVYSFGEGAAAYFRGRIDMLRHCKWRCTLAICLCVITLGVSGGVITLFEDSCLYADLFLQA